MIFFQFLGQSRKSLGNFFNDLEAFSETRAGSSRGVAYACGWVSGIHQKKSHKLIILKGQNAQEDLKKAFNEEKYDYKLENSITNKDSKIILVDFKK